MTRTAILFSGSAYNIRFSIKSAMENLVIPNNADVFIVTERRCLRRRTPEGKIPIPLAVNWHEFELKMREQIPHYSPLTDEEIDLMKQTLGDRLKVFFLTDESREYLDYIDTERKRMMVAVNQYRKESIELGVKPPFGSDMDSPDNGNIRCVVDQYHHVKKAYDLMCGYEDANGFKYDYVMRARIDFVVPEKICIEYYTPCHDKNYWYIMGSFLREEIPFADEFCWFSRRALCDRIYAGIERMGLLVGRETNTFHAAQNNDFRFCAETQFALLIHEMGIPCINVKIYRSSLFTNGGDGYDYMNYYFARADINIEIEYKLACECPSDINEHLPKLKEYAEKCTHVTEMGTRYGNSTVAFMAAYPQKLISYDVTYNDRIDYLKMIAKDCHINFDFRLENVEQIEIEETDLLFIDTNHHAEQNEVELRLHAPKTRKYIIFHDTEVFWERGQGSELGFHGLRYSIEPFLERNKGVWEIAERFTNNNGLLILKRIS